MKKSIIGVLGTALGGIAGTIITSKLIQKNVELELKKTDKFRSYYNMLNQWLILKHNGKSLENYFINKNYKTIAIYGMGEMGNRLYEELKDTSVNVSYAIDKNSINTYSEIDVFELEDNLPIVDVIIVTAVFDFNEIQKQLINFVDFPIISLDEIIYEI